MKSTFRLSELDLSTEQNIRTSFSRRALEGVRVCASTYGSYGAYNYYDLAHQIARFFSQRLCVWGNIHMKPKQGPVKLPLLDCSFD